MTNVPKSSEVKWIHRSAEFASKKKKQTAKVQNIFILVDASSVQLAILKEENPPGWTAQELLLQIQFHAIGNFIAYLIIS